MTVGMRSVFNTIFGLRALASLVVLCGVRGFVQRSLEVDLESPLLNSNSSVAHQHVNFSTGSQFDSDIFAKGYSFQFFFDFKGCTILSY